MVVAVQTHFETWLERSSHHFDETPPAYVERAFRRYLECGILAHGFARAYCDECKRNFLIAFSCKGRGVCPSCNTRRMTETAAYLADHVFPPLPVRQWVLSAPKRLRYFLQRETELQGVVLRIFLRTVERCLRDHSPGCDTSARIGAVAFIHRFGSKLNEHVHFHYCIVNGVFELVDAADEAAGVAFHAASGLDAGVIADVASAGSAADSARLRQSRVDRQERWGGDEGWEHGGGF